MITKLSRKVTIALSALVIYCTTISVLIYIFNPVKYLDFPTLWLTLFMLSTPMFLIIGVAISFLFDLIVISAALKGLAYAVLAGIAIMPYSALILQLTWSNALYYFIFGTVAGLLLFYVQFLFEHFFFRNRDNEVYD